MSERGESLLPVERQKPLPEFIPHRSPRRNKYPWLEMTKVGMSFFVPRTTSTKFRCNIQYWNNKMKQGKYRNRFKTQMFEDNGKRVTKNGVRGIRVWRIK